MTSQREETDAREGIVWWNDLTEQERARWLRRAQSAIPAKAWEAYKCARDWPIDE